MPINLDPCHFRPRFNTRFIEFVSVRVASDDTGTSHGHVTRARLQPVAEVVRNPVPDHPFLTGRRVAIAR